MKFFHIKTKLKGGDFVTDILPEHSGLDPKKVKRCNHSYTPYLSRTLNILKINKRDSILDIGCSKGGALLCMHKYPFRKIHGIEISNKLADIAKSNFSRLGIKDIVVINIDALKFTNYSEYNIFYLYNSLFPETLEKVLKEIIKSTSDKEIIIIYNNPKYAYIFDECELFLVKDLIGNWEHRIFIYSNKKYPNRFF